MKQINEIEGLEKVKEWYYITTCGKVISIMSGVAKILKAGWNFNDFVEIDSGEKCGNTKKYYYIYKNIIDK